jgi:predicted nucleotidyltransferase
MNIDIRDSIHDYLSTQPVLRAYLFGSYSRKTEVADSDIDILLELEDNVDLFQFIAIKLDLQEILKKEVDLISENGVSPRIRPYIDKEKILIYEK